MNNKIFKGLLAATLVVGSVNAHTNRTFLMPRPTGVNLPMETMGFRELVSRKRGGKVNANIQVAGFYKGGQGKTKLGKYFGVNEHDTVSFGSGTSDVVTFGSLVHNNTSDTNTDKYSGSVGTIKFAPKHNEYGARIDIYSNLDKVIKGLYLKSNMPIVHVENDMKISANVTTAGAGTLTNANVLNYFNGTAPSTTEGSYQYGLAYGKIGGKHSKTACADIDVVLGYKLFNKEKYNLALGLAGTCPTGNRAEGVYAFEPIVGNGGHFAFGGALEGMLRLWGKENHNININLNVNYRYLFAGNEIRTLGIKNSTTGAVYGWGQYRSVARIAVIATPTYVEPFAPAANYFTQNCRITPGSQLDGIAGLAYNNGGFTLDLGYNLYFREKESVKRKDAGYIDGTYLLADPATAYGVSAAKAGSSVAITNAMLITDPARTPSQFSNSIYGGVTYAFKNWKYPLMLNAGGAYEWVNKNSAVENWTAMLKLALAF